VRSRRVRGTRRGVRKLSAHPQASFVLVWFRERRPIALTGKGFGISQATATGTCTRPSTCSPPRHPGCARRLRRSRPTVGPTSSSTAPWSTPTGSPPPPPASRASRSTRGTPANTRASAATCRPSPGPTGSRCGSPTPNPESAHDLTCARDHALGALYWAASQLHLPCLADAGYEGTGIGVHTPIKRPNGGELAVDNRAYNRLLRGLRAQGERGYALLTERWRTLQRITLDPGRIGDIMKAAVVLTHYEYGYSTQ